MKKLEIKELGIKDIEERIDEERAILTKLRLNHAVSPLDSPIKIRQTKRLIGRLKTELRHRGLNENN